MRHRHHRELVRKPEVKACSTAVAVPRRRKIGHALSLQCPHHGADDICGFGSGMAAEPRHQVKVLREGRVEHSFGGDRLALEVVDDDRLESIASEIIGKQLETTPPMRSLSTYVHQIRKRGNSRALRTCAFWDCMRTPDIPPICLMGDSDQSWGPRRGGLTDFRTKSGPFARPGLINNSDQKEVHTNG